MTDSSILTTQTALPLLETSVPPSASHPPPSPAVLTNGHAAQDEADAEEGLIKCICTNPDDDGNTIMCDKCETWQHTVCYYSDRPPPGESDPHFCVDCQPRYLDAKAANERQKAARAPLAEEHVQKRAKPGPKAKKKSKVDGANHTNGLANGHGSPRNGTESSTTKRKGRHQSSASTSNIPLKIPTSSSSSSSKRTPNPQIHSPLKSPHSPPIPSDPNVRFSPDFMQLYKNDSGEYYMAVSQFEDINVTTLLVDWYRNPEALAQVTNGKTHDEIFVRSKGSVSEMPQVPWVKHHKEDRNITAHGSNPQWIYITAEKDVGKDAFVGELIGKIGSVHTYTQDPANRWEYLRHPLPFVFFHPQLPIVIDTREEGSVFRYLRRSCEPNLAMKTILDVVNDYHFCFTATREIKAGTELTIPWTTDEHVRRFFAKPTDADVDIEYVSNYNRKVLAEFGGCACNDPSKCGMIQYAEWTKDQGTKPSKGRKKGHRNVGSRSSSEALKQADEEDLEDGTAASNSSRSKPQSRDNTPSSLVDTKNIIGSGEWVSEREKRKIEAVEKLEQKKQPERKKVKRKSADNRQNSHSNAPHTPSFVKKDMEPSAIESDSWPGLKTSPSPINSTGLAGPPPLPPSQPPKPVYSEAGCQADLDCSSLGQSLPSPNRAFVKRPMSSLHRHVFRRSVLKSETGTESPKPSPLTSPEADKSESKLNGTVLEPAKPTLLSSVKDDEGDVKMSDEQETGLGIRGTQLDVEPQTQEPSETPPPPIAAIPEARTPSYTEMKPPPAPPAPMIASNGARKMSNSTPGDVAHSPQGTETATKTANGLDREASPKERDQQPTPMLAPHLAREAEAAATQSPAKRKKINFSQYLARRNSSNISIPDTNENENGRDNLSARGSEEAARSLSPLREEATEIGSESQALETPKTESGDPMLMA